MFLFYKASGIYEVCGDLVCLCLYLKCKCYLPVVILLIVWSGNLCLLIIGMWFLVPSWKLSIIFPLGCGPESNHLNTASFSWLGWNGSLVEI